jgi:hypothetical protein
MPMTLRTTLLAAALALAPATLIQTGCGEDKGNERWATTENTSVEIDWDKVNEAFKQANGPEDFEKRVNEIYAGDEVISVAVQDVDDQTQVVTGFFDKNTSGKVDEGEKIFTIRRDITGEGKGQIQTSGYGPYAGYHSPVMSLVSGMLLGSMISSAFSPRYVPVYTTPYTTPASRVGELHGHRSAYRAQNPSQFRPKASSTGRQYNKAGGRSWGSSPGRASGGGFRSGGGGRFGLRLKGRTKAARLTA